MSTSPMASLPDSTFDNASASSRHGSQSPKWLREPLLHFVILGAVLFVVDHLIVSRADDPHTIVVGVDVDNEATEVFKGSRGRDPTKEELQALRRVWLDNEVLYREGLALEVDKGDTAIRERVIFKALSVVDANVKLPAVNDEVLRAWFEAHREKYDDPARFDFQEAALAGQPSEHDVREFVKQLNDGTPGDAKAGLRVFKNRPLESLAQSYGAGFPKELGDMTAGEWRAMKTKDGWRAIRLDTATPAKPAVFDELRGVVFQDWKDAIAAEQRSAAVHELAKKYQIKFAGDER